MLFGILVSAASSVFIAAPIVLFTGQRSLRRVEAAAPGAVPG
jgi:preprotein translocase subunit SecF